MPSADPLPPRKKANIYWWLGGIFLLLFCLFLLQLIGPSPQIIISPQTTFIATPLRSDGLPDYASYILDRSRSGVTADNNAATILWPTLWPGEVGPSHYTEITTALGLPAIPTSAAALNPLYRIIVNSLGVASTNTDAVEAIEDRLTLQSWTTAQFPPIAKWIDDHGPAFDALVAGSQRPRFYFPSPGLLDKDPNLALGMLVPEIRTLRDASNALAARAMRHAGEHRPKEAWRDLLATHRLARLATQGPWLVDQNIVAVISNTACQGTIAALHECQPSADQAREILRDLESLRKFTGVVDSMDVERMMCLDTVVELNRGNIDAESLKLTGEDSRMTYVNRFRIDWNYVLRKINEYFDHFEAAASQRDRSNRQKALAKIDDDLNGMQYEWTANSLFDAAISSSKRNRIVTAHFLAALLPSVRSWIESEDRANANLQLTRVAAALTVYRAEHSMYPAQLSDLVPSVLDKPPTDLFHDRPYIYHRTADGYILYSCGENGNDDGGSNKTMSIFEGYDLEQLQKLTPPQTPRIPDDADDISIRVPRPPLSMPATTAPTGN